MSITSKQLSDKGAGNRKLLNSVDDAERAARSTQKTRFIADANGGVKDLKNGGRGNLNKTPKSKRTQHTEVSDSGKKAGYERANPNEIRYTQDTASPNFSDGKRTITSSVTDIKANRSVVETDIPPIRVVEFEGKLWTLDNRRLVTFQNAGLTDIPIKKLSLKDSRVLDEFLEKRNPIAGGTKIIIVPRKGKPAARRFLREFNKNEN